MAYGTFITGLLGLIAICSERNYHGSFFRGEAVIYFILCLCARYSELNGGQQTVIFSPKGYVASESNKHSRPKDHFN
jgi:hypothetical protein